MFKAYNDFFSEINAYQLIKKIDRLYFQHTVTF